MSSDVAGSERIAIEAPVIAGENGRRASLELAMHNTGLAFQRTRVAADRTLMAVIRTSLSLIGFGFTIAAFFRSLHSAGSITDSAFYAARNFGVALLATGILLLILGLYFHISFMRSLRRERKRLIERSMMFSDLPYPVSLTTIIAVVLMVIGMVALLSIILHELSLR